MKEHATQLSVVADIDHKVNIEHHQTYRMAKYHLFIITHKQTKHA